MDEILKHLNLVFKVSINSQSHFINKNQNDLIRFVYCGIQKIQKVSRTFLVLYPKLDKTFDELEFSLGILARTLLMDMILVLKLKKMSLDHDGDIATLKGDIKQFCYSVVIDGAKHELYRIFYDDALTYQQKAENYKTIDKIFPNAFDFSKDKPISKLKKVNLSLFCKETKHEKLPQGDHICSLYYYYSKYDHLSHLSSMLPTEVLFEKRKSMLDLSIILTVMHLKDLLAIAHDFDEDYKILFPYITELEIHLKAHYSK